MCVRHRHGYGAAKDRWQSQCRLGERRTLFYSYSTVQPDVHLAMPLPTGPRGRRWDGRIPKDITYTTRQACARQKAYILAARFVMGRPQMPLFWSEGAVGAHKFIYLCPGTWVAPMFHGFVRGVPSVAHDLSSACCSIHAVSRRKQEYAVASYLLKVDVLAVVIGRTARSNRVPHMKDDPKQSPYGCTVGRTYPLRGPLSSLVALNISMPQSCIEF